MLTKRTQGLASVMFMGKNIRLKGQEATGVIVPIDTVVATPNASGVLITSCVVNQDIPMIRDKGLWSFFNVGRQNNFMRELIAVIDADAKHISEEIDTEPVEAAEILAEKTTEVIPISSPESEEVIQLVSHHMDTVSDTEEEYSNDILATDNIRDIQKFTDTDTEDIEVEENIIDDESIDIKSNKTKKGTKRTKRTVSMLEKDASNDMI